MEYHDHNIKTISSVAMCHFPTKFSENRLSNLCVILLTNKQWKKRQWKHNLLDVCVCVCLVIQIMLG